MGELRELGTRGDTKIIWDAEKKEEVQAAKDTFDKLRDQGYFAYRVKKKGDKGEVITQFDPQAEKIILALPMRGG